MSLRPAAERCVESGTRRCLWGIAGVFAIGLRCAAAMGHDGIAPDYAPAEHTAPSHLPAVHAPVDVTIDAPSDKVTSRSRASRSSRTNSQRTIVQTAFQQAAPADDEATATAAASVREPLRLDRPGWPKAQGADVNPVGGDFVRLLTWTLVVLSVGVGGIILLKRTGLGARFTTSPSSDMKLQGTLMIAPRMGVHLVSIASREFLVAVDQRGISAIAVVPPNLAADDDADFDESIPEELATRHV